LKNLTFKKIFWIFFTFDLAMMFLNGATVKSPLLASLCHASIGIFLLFRPIPPENMKCAYGEEKSRRIMRILAVLEIIWSFILKTSF